MEDGWEDLQGRRAHRAWRGEGLGLTAHVPGPWTPSAPVPTGRGACCRPRSRRAARIWQRKLDREETVAPSQLLSLLCSADFWWGFFFLYFYFFFFLNPATLWSHPGPPASSHLLTGGCHTIDIFSGDSWPCGTRLQYGNGFLKNERAKPPSL